MRMAKRSIGVLLAGAVLTLVVGLLLHPHIGALDPDHVQTLWAVDIWKREWADHRRRVKDGIADADERWWESVNGRQIHTHDWDDRMYQGGNIPSDRGWYRLHVVTFSPEPWGEILICARPRSAAAWIRSRLFLAEHRLQTD